MMIPSLARITSECCHAPDAVNVNIASSESVPVFSWLIRWQPSRCPPILDILDIQRHLLSPVYPAHTSSPAPCTEHTDTCWTRSPATALKHQSTAAIQYQVSYDHMKRNRRVEKNANLGTARHILRLY